MVAKRVARTAGSTVLMKAARKVGMRAARTAG
jgi:hypothetical protein